ncbi:hypothetical protein [Massilia phosphatilytica]
MQSRQCSDWCSAWRPCRHGTHRRVRACGRRRGARRRAALFHVVATGEQCDATAIPAVLVASNEAVR